MINCPKCKTKIKLTESLAAPLIEATRQEYERKIALKDADVAAREAVLHKEREALAKAQESIDEQVAVKITTERRRIAADEAKKARLLFGADLEKKTKEVTDLLEVLTERDLKLAEAQQAQADVIRKQRELDDARREMDLTIEKRVQESLGTV